MTHSITWDEELATGHAAIDGDHKSLLVLINRLAEALREGRGKFLCCAIFDEIVRQTQAHFAREERLMAEHGYPKAEEHKAEHATLLRQVIQHKDFVEATPAEISATLLPFLDFWWSHHIQTTDRELAQFIVAAK